MPESTQFSTLSQHVVKALAYFDVFDYPLKTEEVFMNLQSNHVTEADVTSELQKLSSAKILFQKGEFFCLRDSELLVNRRIAGNNKAKSYMAIAARRGRWINRFPFVRAVMISGSLSKNYADDKTDVDYFIITAANRLWIARTLLVLFKRIFLLNSHKYFCVNYFIDEEHLEIEEKNLFTATELSTLRPLHGMALFQRFITANGWVQDILPHAKSNISRSAPGRERKNLLKSFSEMILSSGLGDALEMKFMQLSKSRWSKLYGNKMAPVDFDVAFKSKEYVSKNHPDNYQRKVMNRYRAKLEEFALQHTWKWTHE